MDGVQSRGLLQTIMSPVSRGLVIAKGIFECPAVIDSMTYLLAEFAAIPVL